MLKISIPLEEFEEKAYAHGAGSPEFKWVDEKTLYTDMEKGYKEKRIILQRISDSKYFAFEVNTSPHVDISDSASGNPNPLVGEEVFPKEKTIIVYEEQ